MPKRNEPKQSEDLLAPLPDSQEMATLDDSIFADQPLSGLEDVTQEDLLIPRLAILQKMSPQLEKRHSKFVADAEEGDIIDTATNDISRQVLFLPCRYKKEYLEWAPRKEARGVVGRHKSLSGLSVTEKDGETVTADGNSLVETAQFFGFRVDDGQFHRCFIGMTRSQLRKSRTWLNMAMSEQIVMANGRRLKAPLFYRAYTLGTNEESNSNGSWFGWTVARAQTLVEIIKEHGLEQAKVLEEIQQFIQAVNTGGLDRRAATEIATEAKPSEDSDAIEM